MYELRKVALKFKKTIFNDFSYSFKEKGLYFLDGPSGCGKSTLIKLLYFNHYNFYGNILFNNKSINEYSLNEIEVIRSNICYLSENNLYFKNKNLIDNFRFMLGESFNYDEAIDVLKRFHLDNKISQIFKTLSAGEKQRFLLSLPFLLKRKIILIDEMLSNLDLDNYNLIMNSLIELSKNSLIIIVDHLKRNRPESSIILDFNNLQSKNERYDYSLSIDKNIKTKLKVNKLIFLLSVTFLILFTITNSLCIATRYLIQFDDSKKEAFLQTFPLIEVFDSSYEEKYNLTNNKAQIVEYNGYSYLISEDVYFNHKYNHLKDNFVYSYGKIYNQTAFPFSNGEVVADEIKLKVIEAPVNYNDDSPDFLVNQKTFDKISRFYDRNKKIKVNNIDIFLNSDIYFSKNLQIDKQKNEYAVKVSEGEVFISAYLGQILFNIDEQTYLAVKNGLNYQKSFSFLNTDKEFKINFFEAETWNSGAIDVHQLMIFNDNDFNKYVDKDTKDLKITTINNYYNIDEDTYNEELLNEYVDSSLKLFLKNKTDFYYRYNVYNSFVSSLRYVPHIFLIVSFLLFIIQFLFLNKDNKILFRNNYAYNAINRIRIIKMLISFLIIFLFMPIFTVISYHFFLNKVSFKAHYDFSFVFMLSFIIASISFLVYFFFGIFKQKFDFFNC